MTTARRLRSLNFSAREGHSFVVLRENQLSFAAATRQNSSHAAGASLVVVRGVSGSGKTHLARQAARTLAEKLGSETSVCFTTGERLLEDLKRLHNAGKLHQALDADSRRGAKSQRTGAGEIKALVCDGVEAFAKSQEGQRLLCVVIDLLTKRNGRVVLTVDDAALRTKSLSRRLANRIQAGVQSSIEPLSVASRSKLLEHFCSVNQAPVDAATIRWIAAEAPLGPQELWQASLELKGARDRARMAETIVERTRAAQPISLQRIAAVVAEIFDVSPASLNSSRRLQSLVVPRQMAMHIARELTDLKLVEIGKHFGNRNHSTVLHACRKLDQRIREDPRLRQQRKEAVEQLRTT
jgi:chromosomal replication initiator protein